MLEVKHENVEYHHTCYTYFIVGYKNKNRQFNYYQFKKIQR